MHMTSALRISVGQHSDKGRKAVNQDFHGVAQPSEPLLRTKGIAIALADGIGSSEVSQVASEFAVMGLLDDYYCTSEAWSVKRSVERVLAATNAWLHSRTQQSPYRDNLTVQIVVIDEIPARAANEISLQLAELAPAPLLEARMMLDGYRIVRELHGSHRSHVYLAEDTETGQLVAIKTPSIDLRDDPAYLERFVLEEWVARRINSAHVLKPCPQSRKRNYLYVATEFIDGQSLSQWMIDNPRPALETVRGIVEQIAKGLQAFHRLEMLHQDLRPANIMIDATRTVKIIYFGA